MMAHATWMMLWLSAVALATGCGLGTEIGNGFKPKKEEGGGSAKKSDAMVPPPEDDLDTAEGSDDGADVGDPSVDMEADYLKASLPKSVLLATCGSVFSEDVELPFDLVKPASDVDKTDEALVWTVAKTEGAMVTLRSDSDGKGWDIDRTDPTALVVKHENGDAFDDPYTCREAVDRKVTEQEDGTFVEAATVSIYADESSYTISWAVTYETEDGPRRLKTISLHNEDNAETVELEARY